MPLDTGACEGVTRSALPASAEKGGVAVAVRSSTNGKRGAVLELSDVELIF